MKYGLLDCDDLRSNRGTSIYQTAPKTRLGFWFRSQSIPIIYQRRVSIDQERGILCSPVLPSISRRFFVIGFLWQSSCCKEETVNRAQVPTKENQLRRSRVISCYRGKDRFGLRNCRIVQSSNYFRADDYIIKALPWTRPMLQATVSYDECQTCASKFPTAILQRRSLLEIRYQRTFTTQVRILCDAEFSWE